MNFLNFNSVLLRNQITDHACMITDVRFISKSISSSYNKNQSIAKQQYWISITIFLSGGFSDKQIQLLLLNQPISLILKSRVPGGVVQSFPYNGYDKQVKYGVNNCQNKTHWPYSNGPSESAYWLNGMKLAANQNVRVSHPYQAYRQGKVSVWIFNKIILSCHRYSMISCLTKEV